MLKQLTLRHKLMIFILGIVLLSTFPLVIMSIFLTKNANWEQSMLLIALLSIVWVAGLAVAYWIIKNILRPIKLLNEAVDRFSQGDLEYQVPIIGDGELSQLLTSFNNMSVALKESLGYLNQYALDLQWELEEKQQLMEEQKEMYLNFIKSAAKAIEAKDPYTHGHSERVAEYAVQIARELNLDQETVEHIRVAATLHDIGKIGLQDAILLKPMSLTKEEFDVVKQHPTIGADIIMPLQMNPLVLDGIKHHHERYDAAGYPDAISGEKMSVAARVIGVADAYDAMTSSRPYRRALHPDVAIAELIRGKGTQFDPQIVTAFIAALEKEKESKKHKKDATINIKKDASFWNSS